MLSVVNISAYRFTPIAHPVDLRRTLLNCCLNLKLKGTLLVSPEGINLNLAGERASIDGFIDELKQDSRFSDMTFKESLSATQPFGKMLVKLKKAIIPCDDPYIDPIHNRAPVLSTQELNQLYENGEHFVVLDTRNDYETHTGTFKDAVTLNLKHFRHFPDAVRPLLPKYENTKIVTFCTGGVRCEKAALVMKNLGFKDVYQLEGGILKYFEESQGPGFFEGTCFVFDERTRLNGQLEEAAPGR